MAHVIANRAKKYNNWESMIQKEKFNNAIIPSASPPSTDHHDPE